MKTFMKTKEEIEKLCEKCIVVEKTYGSDGYFFITKKSNFETVNLCECFNNYGHQIGCYDAQCYSFDNSDSDAFKDCLRDLYEHLSVEYSDDDLNYSIEEILEGDNDLLVNFHKNQIDEFIKKWKDENESHVEVEAWIYWDGSNYKTFILEADNELFCDVKELPDEQQEEILSEMPDSPYIENVSAQVETENFIFTFTRFASDPWICSAEKK